MSYKNSDNSSSFLFFWEGGGRVSKSRLLISDDSKNVHSEGNKTLLVGRNAIKFASESKALINALTLEWFHRQKGRPSQRNDAHRKSYAYEKSKYYYYCIFIGLNLRM